MVKSCYACKQEYYPDCGLSFHGFPRDEDMREKWIKAIQQTTRRVTHTSIVCSRHFKKEDYEMKMWKRVLKKEAVPSLRLLPKEIKKYFPGENPNSVLNFGTLIAPSIEERNDTPKSGISLPLLESRSEASEVIADEQRHDDNLEETLDSNDLLFETLESLSDLEDRSSPLKLITKHKEDATCNSDGFENQDVEYLEDSDSYVPEPSESSSDGGDQNEAPQINTKSTEKVNMEGNIKAVENNKENEGFSQALARIDKIAHTLTKYKDDEFDGFGKYIASTLRAMPTKMAIVATKEIQKALTDVQLRPMEY